MQRTARQVHRLFVRVEDRAEILHLERIRELDAEIEADLVGDATEALEHRHRVRILKIMTECFIGDDDIAETQVLVEDLAHAFRAKQRGVQLDERMQAPLL